MKKNWLFLFLFVPFFLLGEITSFSYCEPPVNIDKTTFSMDEALQETLKNQWDIYITKMNVEEQRGYYVQTKAPFDPVFALEGYQNFWTNYSRQMAMRFPDGFTFDFPFVGSWTAHDPGGFKGGGNDAEASASLSKLFRIGTQVQIGAQIDREKNPFNILSDPVIEEEPFQIPYIRQGTATIFFTIDQPLLKGFIHGKQATEEMSQENDYYANQWDLLQEISSKIYASTTAYWDLAIAYELLEQQKQAQDQIQSYYDIIVALIQAEQYPAALISEPARALAESKANVGLARRDVLISKLNLIQAVGRNGNKMPFCEKEPILEKVPEFYEKDLLKSVDIANVTQFALQNRPDLKAFYYKNRSADYTLKGAQNEMLPDLSLFLEGRKTNNGYESGATPFLEPFDMIKPKEEIKVGLSFTLPLYRSLGKGELIVARAQKRKVQYESDKLKAQVYSDLVTAINQYQSLVLELKNLNEAVLQARKYLHDLEALWKEGVSDLFKLLDAHSQLVIQRVRQVSAKGEVAKKIVEVRFLMGLLVEEKKGKCQIQNVNTLPQNFFIKNN
jgi:outer membrane protein TolC